jgi:flagellar M-ring protein FliF
MAEESRKTLIDAIKEWPTSRKLSLAAVAGLCLVFFAVLIAQSRAIDYSLLFANLSSADAARVIEKLKEQKIPYRLEDGGKAIHIPADRVYESRLELAAAGLPQGDGVGFEIFDKQSFGMTDFAQKVNYRRALQGELARTISSLAPVESARVHLALPENRLFREQQQAATSSVIVKLVPGQALREDQIQGIVNLVAGSVEGLDPERVSIIDANGRVLSRNPQGGAAGPMTPGMLEYQLMVEKRLEERAQSLLDRAVGYGNALVRITAELDFSQRESLEESYDPDASVVRSERSIQESGGVQVTGGVPGAQGNLGGAQAMVGGAPASRSEESTDYEVSKVVRKMVEPVGSVKTISVAVLMAERLTVGADGKEPVSVPRNEKEIQGIEQMIKSALGLDEKRGDQIVVVSRPFEPGLGEEPLAEPTPVGNLYKYLPLAKYGLLCLGGVLLYLLLLRPLLKTLQGEAKRIEHFKTVEQLEAELAGQTHLLAAPGDPAVKLRQEIMQGQASPAQIIRNWLKDS